MIVPDGAGRDLRDHPVGTGPYEFVSFAADDRLVLLNRDAVADAMNFDELDRLGAAGTPLSRLLGRVRRRGWRVSP